MFQLMCCSDELTDAAITLCKNKLVVESGLWCVSPSVPLYYLYIVKKMSYSYMAKTVGDTKSTKT